jgi:hypothetical protein
MLLLEPEDDPDPDPDPEPLPDPEPDPLPEPLPVPVPVPVPVTVLPDELLDMELPEHALKETIQPNTATTANNCITRFAHTLRVGWGKK